MEKILKFIEKIIDNYKRLEIKHNDILKHKVKKLFGAIRDFYLDMGYSRNKAYLLTVQIIEELRKNNLIDEKYKELKKATSF